jgi:hypothetical protein
MLLATLMGPGVCHDLGARFVVLWANAIVNGVDGDCVRQEGSIGRRGVFLACWSPAGPVDSVGVPRLGGLSGFPRWRGT